MTPGTEALNLHSNSLLPNICTSFIPKSHFTGILVIGTLPPILPASFRLRVTMCPMVKARETLRESLKL